MRSKFVDYLIYIAAFTVVVYVLALQASGQEFNDESYGSRLDRALQQSLQELDGRVTNVESKVDKLEERVAGLEQADRPQPAKESHPAPATPSVSARWTRAELDAWVRSRYSRSTPIRTGVNPTSAVWRHLQDGNHGFSAAQVNGLEFWVAYALHDAHHRGLIAPFRTSAAVSATATVTNSPARTTVSRTYAYQGCANGRCPRSVRVGPLRAATRWVFR